jgi:thiol:disulfide interchange protein
MKTSNNTSGFISGTSNMLIADCADAERLNMKKVFTAYLCFVIFLFAVPSLAQENKPSSSKYVPVTKYDPLRDADKDINEAVAEANRSGKRVLLEVGGLWCGWCRIMDKYFDENPKLLQFREQNYVTVKINFSPENENKKVLSRYPEISGYPHIYVLDQNGKLLHSQDTSQLESGKSYDLDRFFAFLKKWAPQA